ncbi:MAG TPA: hypothetical protein VNL77_03570, partial [Roseiflexaceae bacterium]|nr:hypothetical protein [Roseiflexaceae bacterium]
AWAWSNRVVVYITPPVGEARQVPFENEVIPLDPDARGDGATAVRAVVVTADAVYTHTGQVETEIVTPVGRAKGQVRVINTIEQPVPLPEGTEFVAQNAAGNQVRFLLDQPVIVPPAVTTVSDTGRSTTYGEVTVNVTARSPGSASNVGANAITQLIIPGQQPYISDQSNFLIRHGPIGGGTEEPQRIVTEAEVQRALEGALTNLYNVGLQELQARAPQPLIVDATTVTPGIAELSDPANYEVISVTPPVGTAVDRANPTFSVMVRARFSALATPGDAPVISQLKTVIPNHFRQPGSARCREGEDSAARDVTYRWTGERLTISGYISCAPLHTVSPETIAKVRAALVGQSREAAAASLRQYQALGLIGGYELPDREEMPPLELLIDVQVQQ